MSQPLSAYALGIDVGGTKIAGAIVGPAGAVIDRLVAPTPATAGAAAILQAIVHVAQTLLSHARDRQITVQAVGVGTGGHVDSQSGVVIYASQTLVGWTGAAVARELSQAIDLPVVVENDVNAMALGELHIGAGRGFTEALYVAVGTGVGGAVVRCRELWRGVSWNAGELGHLMLDWRGDRRCSCGQFGHLSAYASGPAIAAEYARRANRADISDLRVVAARARDGDTLARDVIAEGARSLGLALNGLLGVLDPEALIVGGGVLELGDIWWRPLEAAVRANPMPGPARIALLPAELGQNAAIVGAAWSALQTPVTPRRA